MKHSKRKPGFIVGIILTALCISLFTTVCSAANTSDLAGNSYEFKVTEATSDFYVNDFANLFTDEQIREMVETAHKFDQKSGGIQVVITTVESLDSCVKEKQSDNSFEIEQVSYAMFKQYGIGKDDMGILVLFSTSDRKVRIETGKQMQVYITDSKAGRLLDNYGMSYFRNDQFAEGLISLQKGFISEIDKTVPKDWNGVSSDEELTENPNTQIKPSIEEHSYFAKIQLAGVLAAIIVLIVTFAITIKSRFSYKEKLAETEEKSQKQREEFNKIVSLTRDEKKEQEERFCEQISRLKEQKERESKRYLKKIEELQKHSKSLEAKVASEEEKYARICALHPDMDFEREICKMIEDELKAAASEVDKQIKSCVKLPASKENMQIFEGALAVFNATPLDVQKYVTTNIDVIRSLHQQSVKDRENYERQQREKRNRAAAQEVYQRMLEVGRTVSVGDCQTYKTLKPVISGYNALSAEAKNFFPDNDLPKRINSLFSDAQADHRDLEIAKEAEQEVRSTVNRIHYVSESDLSKLKKSMRCYESLTFSQQSHFDSELLNKLKKFLAEAEEEHERQEEKRRREKEEEEFLIMHTAYHSSSGSSSSSGGFGGFSGHGGGPSGGGASRGF